MALLDDLHADDNCMTLQQIGSQLGFTRERVRQLEKSGLIKLRICLAIENAIGKREAAPILASWRGKSLNQFRAAYQAAKERAQ